MSSKVKFKFVSGLVRNWKLGLVTCLQPSDFLLEHDFKQERQNKAVDFVLRAEIAMRPISDIALDRFLYMLSDGISPHSRNVLSQLEQMLSSARSDHNHTH